MKKWNLLVPLLTLAATNAAGQELHDGWNNMTVFMMGPGSVVQADAEYVVWVVTTLADTTAPPYSFDYQYHSTVYRLGPPAGREGIPWTSPFQDLKSDPVPPGYRVYHFARSEVTIPANHYYEDVITWKEYRWQIPGVDPRDCPAAEEHWWYILYPEVNGGTTQNVEARRTEEKFTFTKTSRSRRISFGGGRGG